MPAWGKSRGGGPIWSKSTLAVVYIYENFYIKNKE
ncbi:hypothetical protein SAMN05192529_1153 [Arachidicoccus rhizosphaerae]|uniref:Uncharacterized protein n=1 Tax=Arachidicoccus rhizosphaerae TaxID=551991 RepID=A0A1H4AIF1_9BACT|nr:hypothetical protein SAMN05192529_1153 [Arachidicoccus rhizosphaerae]